MLTHSTHGGRSLPQAIPPGFYIYLASWSFTRVSGSLHKLQQLTREEQMGAAAKAEGSSGRLLNEQL